MKGRIAFIVILTIAAAVAAFVVPPVSQPLDYHAFADARTMLGIPRFLDVVSNLSFLIVGAIGLAIMALRPAAFASPAEKWPYYVFFVGLALTCAGSGFYHLAPDNPRLVWDRLPITTTLAGLLISQIGDRVNVRLANTLLLPAVVIGAASAWYWHVTDNLVPYLTAQIYAAVATFLIALLFRSRYTHGYYLYWAFAWFVMSKVFETYDQQTYRALGFVSGHTLKHLAAAAAGLAICQMLAKRTRRPAPPSP